MFVSYSKKHYVKEAFRGGCVKIASKNTLSNTGSIFQLYNYTYIILLFDKFWFPNVTDAYAIMNDSESDELYLLPQVQINAKPVLHIIRNTRIISHI
jgi:hypothetical protein